MSKCPKCENDTFELDIPEGKNYCFVVCKQCSSVMGVLENLDIKDTIKVFKEKFNLVVNNQLGIDRLINERTEDIKKEIREQNDKINYILEVAEKLNRKL